jgi:glycosyltransferase involved in cell wall biosynthesis
MASRKYGNEIEILIFGVPLDDLYQADLPIDFPWKLGGVFNPSQVAHLMNDSDIFVDFSSHQAMGLTALEAMASGMAVIVPSIGGSVSFAQHKINSLVVETSVKEACWEVLQLAIEDNELRENIRTQGLIDACDYFPERPAYKILDALNTKKTLK